MTKQIKINVYRRGASWYVAWWIDGEYDGCDALDIEGNASDAEAIEAARTMPMNVEGERRIEIVEEG